MFDSVLVANRGEIAVRVIRTLRRMGIRAVAITTDADAEARHTAAADAVVRVGDYLDIEAVVAAALEAGAEAVHPGYGFLAENPRFARACAAAGLVFVGPPAEAIATMGDKIQAKRTVAAAGVPVVPGRDEAGLTDNEVAAAALELGLPVLLKPSAGGGGKGMRLVRDPGELPDAVAAARREAAHAFGDDTLLVERYVANPRHIEIQVFADTHGRVVHLGERECSLQRRHQKIVEEAPSPLLDAATRAAMGAGAVAAAQAVGYVGAGTVEYIVSADRPGEFFFMEMNTRLQVEHPVTELATTAGDLVEAQLRVAAGEPLPFDEVAFDGHAVEARVYAEDPARGFLPTGGRVLLLTEPEGPGVRVDSGLAEGVTVGAAYDPMLAKVIAYAPDRAGALRLLDRALAGYTLLGVTTNVAFLRELLADPDVAAGHLDTGLVERLTPDPGAPPAAVLAAAALEPLIPDGTGPWQRRDGWQPGGSRWTSRPVAGHDVRVRGPASGAEVAVDGGPPVAASARRDGRDLLIDYAGSRLRLAAVRDRDTLWLGHEGRTWALADAGPGARRTAGPSATDGVVRSPMPGTVLAVKAAVGDPVTAGQPLVIIEAMKMEHSVTSPVDGVVTAMPVRPGAQVIMDETLARVEAP